MLAILSSSWYRAIDTLLQSQSVSIRRSEQERDEAQQKLLEQGQEVGKQANPGSLRQDEELAGLYSYYMTLQLCAERFSKTGLYQERLSGFRNVLKNREKNLPKEHTDAVWNATAEKFRLTETKFRVEGDNQAMQECEQVQRQIDSLLALVPNTEGEIELRKKDF